MIQRTLLHHRFNQNVKAHTTDPARAITDFVEQTRDAQIQGTGMWLVIVVLTVVPGFAWAHIGEFK